MRYATRSAILPYPIPEISSVISSIVGHIKSADCSVYDLTIATALHSVVLAVLRTAEYRYIVRTEVTPHARSLRNFSELSVAVRQARSYGTQLSSLISQYSGTVRVHGRELH